MLAGFDDKGAKAVCTFALALSKDEEPIVFQGITEVSRSCRPFDDPC